MRKGFVAWALAVAACTPGEVTLTVNGGAGSGAYAPGTEVTLSAHHDPNRSHVVGWTGSVEGLADPLEWTSSYVVPDRDAVLEPIVEEITWAPEERTVPTGAGDEQTILAQIPNDPTGLLLALHGTGGSRNFPVRSIAMATLARGALARGMGVISLDAHEVQVGEDLDGNDKIRWDAGPRSDNPDLLNVQAALDALTARGEIEPSTPIYAVGMSNGGSMAFTLGAVLDVDAVAIYCASGRTSLGGQTTTPTAWFVAANDTNDNVDNDNALALHEALVARGIPTQFRSRPASPLYDERFARVDGIDDGHSRELAAAVRSAGLVGPDDQWTLAIAGPDLVAALRELAPFAALLETPGRAAAVLDEIRQMQADHQMYDDFAQQTLDFLEGR